MITKKDFVSARYIDNERKNIEILLKNDNDEVNPYIIEHDEESTDFKSLVKIITVDELHESTVNHNRVQRTAFEDVVKGIAEAEGLTFKNLKQDELFDIIIDTIIEEANPEDLFKFKLKIFDIQSVKECKSREVKAEIRKAKTIAEVISAFSKM